MSRPLATYLDPKTGATRQLRRNGVWIDGCGAPLLMLDGEDVPAALQRWHDRFSHETVVAAYKAERCRRALAAYEAQGTLL